jgi:hypothetical protein
MPTLAGTSDFKHLVNAADCNRQPCDLETFSTGPVLDPEKEHLEASKFKRCPSQARVQNWKNDFYHGRLMLVFTVSGDWSEREETEWQGSKNNVATAVLGTAQGYKLFFLFNVGHELNGNGNKHLKSRLTCFKRYFLLTRS